MVAIGGRGSGRGTGAVTLWPTLSRFRRVRISHPCCTCGWEMFDLEATGGHLLEGGTTIELLGVFSTSVLSDDGRVLSPVGPPTTALFRALLRAGPIALVTGDPWQGTPQRSRSRFSSPIAKMIAFGAGPFWRGGSVYVNAQALAVDSGITGLMRAGIRGENLIRRGVDRGNKSTADRPPDEACIAIFRGISTT